MFPIVHHYADTLLNPATDALMIYGGLFPDLASSAGLTRNFAHACGPAFYAWAKKNAPEALPMARAVLCHGTVPPGLDHYADESWGEGPKGWCFQRGARYMEGVRRATPLAENYILWKAHNFIEMALEMDVLARHPGLNKEILLALDDRAALRYAAQLLAAAFVTEGARQADLQNVFSRAADIFAIENVNPTTLAEKQALSFIKRFGLFNSDVPAMAELLTQMYRDLGEEGQAFLDTAIPLVGKMLEDYPA